MPDTAPALDALYADHVNPHWVRLLDILQMNARYERCIGAELFTRDGRRILDFLSGYCVHNAGHNHPAIVEALHQELDRGGPAMLQSHVPERAGELAEKLCARAGGRLKKVFFASSGSEGVEAAIKFSRASTDHSRLLHANGAFHGLTCGALSLMGDPFWRDGFGPLLPGAEAIPFDDPEALESSRYPTAIFAPDRFDGQFGPDGSADLQVHGLFKIHGAEHEVTFPMRVQMQGDLVTTTTHFVVPYVKWGMKNPSNFLLHVSDKVQIEIRATGHTHPAAG